MLRSDNMLRTLFWTTLLFHTQLAGAVAENNTSSVNGATNVFPWSWIPNPPAVRKVVFRETRPPQISTDANRPGVWSVANCEGGLQSNSWYLRYQSVFPPVAGIKEGDVVGLSSNTFWTLSPIQNRLEYQTTAAPSPQKTNGVRTGVDQKVLDARRRLAEVMRFGVPEVKLGSWTWDSSNSFTFTDAVELAPIQGKVEWDMSNRVAAIEYRMPVTGTNRVNYRYRATTDHLPREWTVERQVGTERQLVGTWVLDSLELGSPEPGFAGYHFDMFRPENGVPIRTLLSNGVAVAVPPELSQTKAEFKRSVLAEQTTRLRYRILLAGMGISVLLLAAIQWLRRKYPSPRPEPVFSPRKQRTTSKKAVDRPKRVLARGKR